MSFCVLLFRAFLSSVPRELDEAAVIDGAGPLQLFFRVVLPLLRPVIVTIVVVQSVFVCNDFAERRSTSCRATRTPPCSSRSSTSRASTTPAYNLLFMDILLVTIPPLILFLFFQRQIVAGMTAGAVKG